jgi:hypothetical protein
MGLVAETLARQPNGLLGAAAAELVNMIKPSPTASSGPALRANAETICEPPVITGRRQCRARVVAPMASSDFQLTTTVQ